MTVEDFVSEEHKNLDRFLRYWKKKMAEEPSQYPRSNASTMRGGYDEFSWDEQYEAFHACVLGTELEEIR